MIVPESVLAACAACSRPEISFAVEHLSESGARRRRHYCDAHCPDSFVPDREQRDWRYTTGLALPARA